MIISPFSLSSNACFGCYRCLCRLPGGTAGLPRRPAVIHEIGNDVADVGRPERWKIAPAP
jgi:hypothetical protein